MIGLSTWTKLLSLKENRATVPAIVYHSNIQLIAIIEVMENGRISIE
jgi:hypothetical protein